MTDWKETTLWKHLEAASGDEAEAARALLVQEMPKIQTILTQAHTAPTDFTLHDADHSFRVAKWMAEIIPGDVLEKLSPYEIALLLLAAYLHDIGMTPEQGRVDRFWSHLVYGAPDPKGPRQPLTDEEARDLQGWLDDEGRDLTIPLAPDGAASEETKRLADSLITHYCRHKHNDWSGEWIRANLRREALPGYETWVDDLVQLCRSHHERYDELKQSRFDPRPAGPSGRPVHHRYLACALRVADVLEIDPERTPEVIFRHREIHPGSVLYWRKDHENWVIRDGNSLVLAAYPESAVIENAIRKTADGIREELATCARLNREQPFFHWQLRPNQQLPHRWDFPEMLMVHVQPRNDAYVYIDGAFRPNTEKLLELLSGAQLYGNPLVAVRELLQNAFDAVKEEMAYQRLERPNDPEYAKHLAATHRVELRLEERDGRRWLVCKDTGVGMTRRIIENYLLVSGNSRRREIVELERRCSEAGFRLGRTGQFGIGVLSYFMLADRVEILTRRSAARADAETTGWSFVTEGVGSFGELKKEPSAAPGTELRLRLIEGPKRERPFESELKEYVTATVRYIPCILELQGLGETGQAISWRAGWVHSLEEFTKWILWEMREEVPDLLLPSAKRDKIEANWHLTHAWWQAAQEALRWSVIEGELPNRLGIYRISIPWFELPGGCCEAFMLVRSEGRRRIIKPRPDGMIGIFPGFDLIESIHGMGLDSGIEHEGKDARIGFWEINWESSEAGHLRVDRSSLEPSSSSDDAKEWVEARAREILAEALVGEKPSEYAFLSGSWLEELGTKLYWALGEPKGTAEFVWGPVSFPVVCSDDLKSIKASFRGKNLKILFPLQFLTIWGQEPLFPSFFWTSPDRIVATSQRSSSFRAVRLWNRVPKSDRRCLLGRISHLPPEWGKVCGVKFSKRFMYSLEQMTVWNVDHPMVSQIDKDSTRWFEEVQGRSPRQLNLAALSEDMLAPPGRAAQVLAWVLSEEEEEEEEEERKRTEDVWNVLLERAPSLARRLLHAVLGSSEAGEEEGAVGFLKSDYIGRWQLIVLSADSIKQVRPGDPLFEEFLPDPGPDWTITEALSDNEPT
jgi:hypothetical protein